MANRDPRFPIRPSREAGTPSPFPGEIGIGGNGLEGQHDHRILSDPLSGLSKSRDSTGQVDWLPASRMEAAKLDPGTYLEMAGGEQLWFLCLLAFMMGLGKGARGSLH